MWSGVLSLALALYSLPGLLWPGMLGGAGLLALLGSRSRYREGSLWFVGLPGLYVFWGVGLDFASLQRAFGQWALLGGSLLLWGLAYSRMHHGSRWATAWLLPFLLLKPSGLTLALLVGVHGLYMLEYQRAGARELGRSFRFQRHSLLGLAAILLTLGLFTSLVPVPQVRLFSSSSTAVSTPQPGPAAPAPAVQPRPSQPAKITVRRAQDTPFSRFAATGTDLLFTGLLLMLAVITLLVLIPMLRSRQRIRWLRGRHLLMLGVIAFSWAMLLFWLALSRPESAGGSGFLSELFGVPGSPAAAGDVEIVTTNQDLGYAIGLLLALLAFVLVGFGLYLLLRNWSTLNAPEQTAPAPTLAPRMGGWHSGPPAHRVRRAYYHFLHAMEKQGLARLSFESPRDYAGRLGQKAPLTRAYLAELTALYEPVRYGQSPSEAEALRAEFLAAQIPLHFEESP